MKCPEEKQLSDLIAGTLPEAVAETLTEHLGGCEQCQSVMQRLAKGPLPVDSMIADSTGAEPPHNSAYWAVRESFIDQLGAGVDVASANTQAYSKSSISETGVSLPIASDLFPDNELSFLEPSEDSTYIGRLQQFEISRVIGRGGMGIVLEGFDPHLRRPVAIKVLHAQYQKDTSAIERFCREGRAAAAISHEHVVQMFQVSRVEEGEIAFLVMQLIEGETLETILEAQSPMAPDEAARIAMQIAAGLSAAHDRGLVHRDIKPSNILVEKSTGRAKLTDFGLAFINEDVGLTRTGLLLGTALYMSPEQALGKTVDERSDLFSLGAVMYEMATGKVAFSAPTAVGVMKLIMDTNPTAPHKINPEIRKPTSDLIMQLLSKDPNKRPDSAGEVARVLASIVTEHGPISPLQVPAIASSEVRKLSKEHHIASRTWAIGGWIIAGLLISGLAVSIMSGWSPWDYAARNNDDSRDAVSVALYSEDADPKDVTEQFPSVLLPDNPGTVWSIDFANDGETIAAGIGDGSVRIWNIDKQEVVRSFKAHAGNVWNVKFHPSRNLFATAGDDSWVKLWDLEDFSAKQGWKLDNTVRAIAFSPDGKTLAAGDRDGELHIYDIQTYAERNTIKLDGTTILGVDYSTDGKFLVAAGSDKIVRVFDAVTLEERQSFSGHEGPIYSVAFAPNSPLIASVGFKSDTWIWNSETGENVMTIKGAGGDNWGVGFCGTGRHLLTGGQDGKVNLWDMSNGKKLVTFQGHSAAVHNFAFDPDRKRMASSSRDGTVRVWDTQALRELTE